MKKYRVAVPAGIGDFSWLWSKLSTIPDATWEFYPPDTFPERTSAYISLLPNCKVALGKHTYPDIIVWGNNHVEKTWARTVKNYDEGDVIYLQVNEHLGQGRPLADWMPDLNTDFHYKINYKSDMHVPESGPTLAFHTASIRGIRAYEAWMPETWVKFLLMFHSDFPTWKFMALGGFWDIDTIQEIKGSLPARFPLIDNVGRTGIEDVIQILSESTYYLGYSSGLNVIRNVLGMPGATLWPKPQTELMYSWADPIMTVDRDYMGFLYDSAERIYLRIKPKIRELQTCLTVGTSDVL
jgi:hypothetical protein